MNNSELIHNFASIDNFYSCDKRHMNVSIYYDVHNQIVKLYSYSTVIAKRDLNKDIYLISTRTYSNTTSKQQSILSSATHGYNRIYVYDVNNTNEDNIKYFIEDIKNACLKQSKARAADYMPQITRLKNYLESFINYINIDKRSKLYKEAINIINVSYEDILSIVGIDKQNADRLELQRKKAMQKQNKRLIKDLNNISFLEKALNDYKQAFIKDEEFYKAKQEYSFICTKINQLIDKKSDIQKEFLYHKDILKVDSNCNVITSQNIKISKEDAIKLYKIIDNNLLKVGDIILSWRCINVTKNYIIVGCHTIAKSDIKECYIKLTECKGV